MSDTWFSRWGSQWRTNKYSHYPSFYHVSFLNLTESFFFRPIRKELVWTRYLIFRYFSKILWIFKNFIWKSNLLFSVIFNFSTLLDWMNTGWSIMMIVGRTRILFLFHVHVFPWYKIQYFKIQEFFPLSIFDQKILLITN